VFNVRMRMRVR